MPSSRSTSPFALTRLWRPNHSAVTISLRPVWGKFYYLIGFTFTYIRIHSDNLKHYFIRIIFNTEQVHSTVKLLTSIWEMVASSCDQGTNCRDCAIPLFFSVPSDKCHNSVLNHAPNASFNTNTVSVFADIS